ncbi:MAG: PfkB family carbohydrate kinase [Actinomyces graevenitzii]|uniref:PfkB family carbohydrate kinase n=1 Tax=Actinomyces graevenitzii TaxID=55565 RepID=A0A9E7D700_9ACTO|nr:MAG: PfkB family carbohydrate kinase [Actinomyces graevenitzii]
MDPRFSRAYGALAGLALGDALGMPTQAMSPQQIQTVYGQVTGLVDGDKTQPYAPGMAAGSVTDDTEQALLIASLLLKGHGSGLNLDASEFSHALLAWEDSMIERGSLDLLGPSTKAALERVRAGENPLRVGGEGTTNGAAMRVTPIGIAASTSDRQLFADAVWSSCQVTHATRQGFQSAALVAAAVSLGIDAGAADVTDLLWKAVAFVRSLPERGAWSPEPDVVAATHRALKLAAQPSSSLEWLAEQIGTSVASAQAIPMAFALLARDPSPCALLQAANLGGDTDTIGAIAGAILGASLGVEVFDAYGLAQVEQVSQLDLPSVATDLLALRDREGGGAVPAAATTSPKPEKPTLTPAASPQKGAQAGRVVLMGQILVDLAVRGEALPAPGGDVWASDEGMHVGGGFNALVAARRMGAQAVSLSPIGHGPYSLLIQQALQRAEITDAGPRIDGVDNGFCIAFTDQSGERTFISTRGAETRAPARAWADFTATMRPGDVLYIDGYLMDHPANRQAAQAALEALPEGVQVILDVSPVIGIPQGLPARDVIVSMNHREAQQIINQSAERGLGQGQERSRGQDQGHCQKQGQDGEQSQGQGQLCGQGQEQGQSQGHCQAREAGSVASLVASLLGCPVVVRAGAEGAYFARPAASANAADVTYIPTPRVAAIDTNGAGDAHSGVLAAALAQAIPLERALLLANCAGALSTTLVGPAVCPAREQIEAAADALAD